MVGEVQGETVSISTNCNKIRHVGLLNIDKKSSAGHLSPVFYSSENGQADAHWVSSRAETQTYHFPTLVSLLVFGGVLHSVFRINSF